MASEKIDQYITAKAEYDKATQLVKDVQRAVSSAASVLRDPADVAVSGSGLLVGSGRGTRADLDSWPSAEDIRNALIEWHRGHERALGAYQQIPAGERAVVTAPPALDQIRFP